MKRADICAKHKISQTGMRNALIRQKSPLRSPGRTTSVDSEVLAMAVAERCAGASYGALEARHGVSKHVVSLAIDKAILADIDDDVSVREIRRRYAVGTHRVDRVRREAERKKTNNPSHTGVWPDDDELRRMNAACARKTVRVDGFGASSLVGVG
ncbi:MAG: hypothetical protein OEU92_29990 [Alphaproteobacteria bacterium]|nr:hypothetical protein [Alphaproteobacteria bacterium]